ncbi:hypothetical protein D9M69_714640 [compost metagenome]
MAGTISVYSKNAMPQLARIATNSGDDVYFRCPYQAKVMKTFEASSRNRGRTRSIMAGPLGRGGEA